MIREFVKSLPGINYFIKTNIWKSFRHRLLLFFSDRTNATFTLFLRLPTQFEALSGPVLDFLLSNSQISNLIITVLGCSNGAEPYTIASVLKNRHPDLKFSIYAYDIDKEMIKKAKSACYFTKEEAFRNEMLTTSFINDTFDNYNHSLKIKPKIAELIHFEIGNALDPSLKDVVKTSDIVFAQNFLFHLKPKLAQKAFKNICSLLKPKAALFIDGMDLSMRQKLTLKYNLVPLDFKIREIHNEARIGRTSSWPWIYWGLEPFSNTKKRWQRRYSTIFLKI